MIDPVTAATMSSAFTSVVGLIGQFKSGRDSASGSDFNDFMTWLTKSNHHEIKSLIEASHATSIGIKAVLNQQSDHLNHALSKIDAAVAAFASTLDGFADISAGMKPDSVLSVQALSILKQFDSAKASTALESMHRGQRVLYLLDGDGEYIEANDHQFLEDDLMRLIELRLLLPDHNKNGERLFRYTRAASNLVKSALNQGS